jgi:hypothetical protein
VTVVPSPIATTSSLRTTAAVTSTMPMPRNERPDLSLSASPSHARVAAKVWPVVFPLAMIVTASFDLVYC